MLSAIMQFTWVPSLRACPRCPSLFGFDPDGLPMGMRVIGRRSTRGRCSAWVTPTRGRPAGTPASNAPPHPALSPSTGERDKTTPLRNLLEGVAGSEDGAVLPVATDQHH